MGIHDELDEMEAKEQKLGKVCRLFRKAFVLPFYPSNVLWVIFKDVLNLLGSLSVAMLLFDVCTHLTILSEYTSAPLFEVFSLVFV